MQKCKDAKMQSKNKTKRLSFHASMHLFTICLLIFTFCFSPVLALEFDTSIDDDIRKNYNPDKLDEDMSLPALPKILKEKEIMNNAQKSVKPQTNSDLKPISSQSFNTPKQIQQEQPQPVQQAEVPSTPTYEQNLSYKEKPRFARSDTFAVIKKGTRIHVRLKTELSDRTRKGTRVTFVSEYPVSTTCFTIHSGTVFRGEVVESHKPQLSGNGGLIVVKINSVMLNNQVQPINAFVVNANHKHIFFNKMKGKRRFVASMFKSMHPGERFFKKMMGVTGQLATDGSSILLTPFSLCLGTLGLAGNVLISPTIALFSKGNSINISEGSEFVIKLAEDVYIYN